MNREQATQILKKHSGMLTAHWNIDEFLSRSSGEGTDEKSAILEQREQRERVILGLAEWIQSDNKEPVTLGGQGLAGLRVEDLEIIVELVDYLLLSDEAVELIASKIYIMIRYSAIMRSLDGYDVLFPILLNSLVVYPSWGIARLGADGFINHPMALKLSVDQFADLLSLDRLFLGELELAQRAIEWCEDKPDDEIARVMKCIRWDKLNSIQFPYLVNDLFSSGDILRICKAFPEILLKLAQVTKTYSRDSSFDEFELSIDRRGSEPVWRRYISDFDETGWVGMVCLNPSPHDLYLGESFIDSTGWNSRGMHICIRSGTRSELHLLDEWVRHVQINRSEDKSSTIDRCENGEARCTLTTKFTGTYFVRIGPRV